MVCGSCNGLCYTMKFWTVTVEWRTWMVVAAAIWQAFDAGDDRLSRSEFLRVKGQIVVRDRAIDRRAQHSFPHQSGI